MVSSPKSNPAYHYLVALPETGFVLVKQGGYKSTGQTRAVFVCGSLISSLSYFHWCHVHHLAGFLVPNLLLPITWSFFFLILKRSENEEKQQKKKLKRIKYPEVAFRIINYIEQSTWLWHNIEGGLFILLWSYIYSCFIVFCRNLVTLRKTQGQESHESIFLWKEHDLGDWTLISSLS